MTLNQLMFYLFSLVIIICSVLTITSRRILRAAVYLLFVLISTSGLYFLFEYQFMAATQLILYGGGIVVLIIFSILLTSHISHRLPKSNYINIISGVIVAAISFALSVFAILKYPFQATSNPTLVVDAKTIGNQLMSVQGNGYALPFEVISILLLAAMISAIIIAKKGK